MYQPLTLSFLTAQPLEGGGVGTWVGGWHTNLWRLRTRRWPLPKPFYSLTFDAWEPSMLWLIAWKTDVNPFQISFIFRIDWYTSLLKLHAREPCMIQYRSQQSTSEALCKWVLWEYLRYFVISSCHFWVKKRAPCILQAHLIVSDAFPNVFCQNTLGVILGDF